jgi:hypothetical protein
LQVDDCCVDLERLEKNFKELLKHSDGIRLTYAVFAYDCGEFPETLIKMAVERSRNYKTWLCNLDSDYELLMYIAP